MKVNSGPLNRYVVPVISQDQGVSSGLLSDSLELPSVYDHLLSGSLVCRPCYTLK